MTRKALAMLIVVVVTGLAPATAVLGFCARMPCCFAESENVPALTVARADCCNTISCYEGPSQNLTVSAKIRVFPPTALAFAPVILPASQVSATTLTFDDTSPPRTTSERLSSLSILLI